MTRNMATTGASNNSWGAIEGPGLDPAAETWEMAIDTGVTTGYGGKGVVYVWSAGNGYPEDNSNFDGYTNYYGVTAVCAVDNRGRRSSYSEAAPIYGSALRRMEGARASSRPTTTVATVTASEALPPLLPPLPASWP